MKNLILVDKNGNRIKDRGEVKRFSCIAEAINWVHCGRVWPDTYIADSGLYIFNEKTDKSYNPLTGEKYI